MVSNVASALCPSLLSSVPLAVAKDLMGPAEPMVLCGVAGVVELLSLCDSVAQCSFYWVVLVLFVGAQPGFLRAATAADGDVVRDRLLGWSSLMANATGRMMGLRAKALAAVGRDHLHIFKQPLPPKPDPAAGSAILLYTFLER